MNTMSTRSMLRRFGDMLLSSSAYSSLYDLKHFVLPPAFLQRTYSQEGEELVIRRFFKGRRDGFYVDVGAHEPRRYSNTHFLHKDGWRGINIEPNPECAAHFLKERPRDVCLNLGIGPDNRPMQYFMFNAWELNTFDPEIAAQRQREGHPLVETRMVPVRPLAAVLAENVPAGTMIDLMTVDVEGFDLEVLRTNDWARFSPRLLLVEIFEKDLRLVLDSDIAKYLLCRGYVPVAKTFNTLFFHDSRSLND